LSIGPTFECPVSLVERLPEISASHKIRMEIVNPEQRDALAVYCVFKSRCGRIDARLSVGDKRTRIWLTFPRTYALNPLLWPLNFRLIRRIEHMLLHNSARRCDWSKYARGA
jgi:hypothetical protein